MYQENRSFIVYQENRKFIVYQENRSFIVYQENRSFIVYQENVLVHIFLTSKKRKNIYIYIRRQNRNPGTSNYQSKNSLDLCINQMHKHWDTTFLKNFIALVSKLTHCIT